MVILFSYCQSLTLDPDLSLTLYLDISFQTDPPGQSIFVTPEIIINKDTFYKPTFNKLYVESAFS